MGIDNKELIVNWNGEPFTNVANKVWDKKAMIIALLKLSIGVRMKDEWEETSFHIQSDTCT